MRIIDRCCWDYDFCTSVEIYGAYLQRRPAQIDPCFVVNYDQSMPLGTITTLLPTLIGPELASEAIGCLPKQNEIKFRDLKVILLNLRKKPINAVKYVFYDSIVPSRVTRVTRLYHGTSCVVSNSQKICSKLGIVVSLHCCSWLLVCRTWAVFA